MVGCDGAEKQEYEGHHEQIVNRANVRDLEQLGEQRGPFEEHLIRQRIFFAGFPAEISKM